MEQRLYEALQRNPIIAAVRDDEGLAQCLRTDIPYLLAPALDNLLSRIDARKLGIVAAVLLVLYCADQVYSAQHPNVGAGITDYKGSDTSLEAPTPYEIRK